MCTKILLIQRKNKFFEWNDLGGFKHYRYNLGDFYPFDPFPFKPYIFLIILTFRPVKHKHNPNRPI